MNKIPFNFVIIVKYINNPMETYLLNNLKDICNNFTKLSLRYLDFACILV